MLDGTKENCIKFGFYEKATKYEKDLGHTFDKSVVFCAHNSVLVQKLTKILKKNEDKSYYTNFNCINAPSERISTQ